MPSARVAAIALTLLIAVGACNLPATDDDGDGAPDSPDSEDVADPEETDAADGDEPAPDTDLDEALRRTADEVATLRDLQWREEVETEVVSGEELAKIATERDLDEGDREDLDAWSQVLAALRLIPHGADLEEIYDELHASGIAGLYDPVDEVAYVSSEELPLGPAAQTTTAHELVHALQDQHFDLARLHDLDDDDEALAFLSVVEGDAVLVEEAWAARHLSEEEREQAEQERLAAAMAEQDTLAELPEYILEGFLFPYTAGERFVAALREEGGLAAVDAALDDPPTTTLEILDPDRYLEGFEPVEVEPGSAPSEAWEPAVSGSFGAFDLLALFGAVTETEAGSTWPWWEGGAVEAWRHDGEITVAAGWSFSAPDAAAVVCSALPRWYVEVADAAPVNGADVGGDELDAGDLGETALQSDRDAFMVRCDDETVRFAIAPDAESATATLGP